MHCQRTPPTADPCTCSRSMRTCYIVMLQPVPHMGCEALQQVSPRSHSFSRACLPTKSNRVCMLVFAVSGMQLLFAGCKEHMLYSSQSIFKYWGGGGSTAFFGGGGARPLFGGVGGGGWGGGCSTAVCGYEGLQPALRRRPCSCACLPAEKQPRAYCCCTDKLLLFGVSNKQVKCKGGSCMLPTVAFAAQQLAVGYQDKASDVQGKSMPAANNSICCAAGSSREFGRSK